MPGKHQAHILWQFGLAPGTWWKKETLFEGEGRDHQSGRRDDAGVDQGGDVGQGNRYEVQY